MKYDVDGHVWWAPTPKPWGGWICHKDSGTPPTPPDPKVVSGAQTESNIATANANANLNRVNQITPYGNLTYTKTPGAATFDDAGYQKALADYNAQGRQVQDEFGNFTTQNNGTAPDRAAYTTPGTDQWTSNITLSPDQQQLLSQNTDIQKQLSGVAGSAIGNVRDTMGQPLDLSSLGAYGTTPTGGGAQKFTAPDANYTSNVQGGNIQTALPNNDYAAQRKSVEDAIYSRVNPQLERDRNALDVKLSNQGIMPGSEAYITAIDESDRQANDARMQAILAGGQEQSRLAGLDLAAGQFANNAQAQGFGQGATNAALNNSVNDTRFSQGLMAMNQNNQANQQDFSQQIQASQAQDRQRQQQMEELAYKYNMPLNTLTALMSGSQVTNPTFGAVPSSNVAGTNVSGDINNAYQAQLGNASNQTAANNGMTSGLMSLAGTAAMFF